MNRFKGSANAIMQLIQSNVIQSNQIEWNDLKSLSMPFNTKKTNQMQSNAIKCNQMQSNQSISSGNVYVSLHYTPCPFPLAVRHKQTQTHRQTDTISHNTAHWIELRINSTNFNWNINWLINSNQFKSAEIKIEWKYQPSYNWNELKLKLKLKWLYSNQIKIGILIELENQLKLTFY